MSERLTDKALAELEDIAFLRLSQTDRDAGMRAAAVAAIRIRDLAAKRYLVNLVIELRERRAADLTHIERFALQRHWDLLDADPLADRAVIAAIDKLLAAHGAKP